MYYILIETQKQGDTMSAPTLTYTDLATAVEATYSKAAYVPKTSADYMGVTLIRNDGVVIIPMISGPIVEQA